MLPIEMETYVDMDRAGFWRRQFLLVESGFDILEHLSFGLRSQYQLGLLDREWKIGSRRGRVEADRGPQLGIPKIRVVDSGGP